MRSKLTILRSLVLLIIVGLPGILFVGFSLQKQWHKMEMEEQLEQAALTTIQVPKASFQWYEEGKEILVEGQLFDVEFIQEEGDHYLIKGLFDEAEKKIDSQLADLLNKKQEKTNSILFVPLLMQPYHWKLQEWKAEWLRHKIVYCFHTVNSPIQALEIPPKELQ